MCVYILILFSAVKFHFSREFNSYQFEVCIIMKHIFWSTMLSKYFQHVKCLLIFYLYPLKFVITFILILFLKEKFTSVCWDLYANCVINKHLLQKRKKNWVFAFYLLSNLHGTLVYVNNLTHFKLIKCFGMDMEFICDEKLNSTLIFLILNSSCIET